MSRDALQAEVAELRSVLARTRGELRRLSNDILNSRLDARETRSSVVTRISEILDNSNSADAARPTECHCTNPIEPSAMCPVHGIKRGQPVTFVNADGSVTGRKTKAGAR